MILTKYLLSCDDLCSSWFVGGGGFLVINFLGCREW